MLIGLIASGGPKQAQPGDTEVVTGRLRFDTSKPDGTPRTLLDVSRLRALGWEAGIGLREGLESTYGWYVAQEGVVRWWRCDAEQV